MSTCRYLPFGVELMQGNGGTQAIAVIARYRLDTFDTWVTLQLLPYTLHPKPFSEQRTAT